MRNVAFAFALVAGAVCGLAASCGGGSEAPPETGDGGGGGAAEPEPEPGAGPGIDPSLDPAAHVLAPHPTPPEVALPVGVPVRVVTYNVHGGGDATAEELGLFLGSLGADLVLLQECPYNVADGAKTASGFPFLAAQGDKAILSKTPLSETKLHPLGSRSALRARTDLFDVPFSVWSVHLSWDADGDAQAVELLALLEADPLPHRIAGGDYNDEHTSTQITLLEEHYEDAFTKMGWHPSDRISWPATDFDGSEGSQLIDLVFFPKALGVLVVSGDVLDLAPPLSDHKPSVVDLRFPFDPSSPFAVDPFWPHRDPFRVFPPEAERPPNLLQNPGAEEGLAGWEVEGGATTAASRANQLPRTGAAFFVGHDGAPSFQSSGTQAVDLAADAAAIDAGLARLLVSGWWAVGYEKVEGEGEAAGFTSNLLQPQDHGELVLRLLDGDGAEVLRHASGPRDPYVPLPWAAAIDVPPGARTAALSWIGHAYPSGPAACDVAFDDLYLGLQTLESPHARLGGNLLLDPGAEEGGGAWQRHGFRVHGDLDLEGYGFAIYPARAWSGARFFYGQDRLHETAGPADGFLAQTIAVADHPHLAGALAEGRLALRWGGRVRTWATATTIRPRLEVQDHVGNVWHTFEAEPVFAAEWTAVEALTLLPPGTAAVRFTLDVDLSDEDEAAYADDLFVLPERAP